MAKARSYEDKSVSTLAKELVRLWKSKVDVQREAKKKECEWDSEGVCGGRGKAEEILTRCDSCFLSISP